MMELLQRLNLRPHEQRLVVIIGVLLFVVLNVWLVWPHFDEWNRVRASLRKAHTQLQTYQKEIAQAPSYKARLQELEGQGSAVLAEEQAVHLRRTLDSLIAQSGVAAQAITFLPKATVVGNEFFEEQPISMGFAGTGQEELINFLFSLSAGNSMIRVRDLNVSPEPGLTKLKGGITLTASLQKAPGSKPAATKPATTKTTTTSKPADDKAKPPPARTKSRT